MQKNLKRMILIDFKSNSEKINIYILTYKCTLFSQIQKILDDESTTTKFETNLASLTAGDRITWAQARNKHFAKGVNKSSLHAIEKVRFFFELFLFDNEL